LIAAGFGLGAAAVYFFYPRKAASEPEGAPNDEASEPADAATEAPPSVVLVEGTPAEIAAPTVEESPPPAPAPLPNATAESNGDSRMAEQAPPVLPSPEPRLFPVVTLLRDEVTGQLALQVGPRLYHEAQALRESSDWTRVEFAARDLARWVEGGAAPPRRTEAARPEEPPKKTGTMVEQISRILETKLAAQSASGRGVRLVEGPGGAVRVYIGVQPYSLEEVPDPAIRAAIREAVAEWEASR
jgi:hypothetical protein